MNFLTTFYFLCFASVLTAYSHNCPIEQLASIMARHFDMPALASCRNEKDMKWFFNRRHLKNDSFFRGILTKEVEKNASFEELRAPLAKYCLKQGDIDSPEVNDLANILVEAGDYLSLIEIFIETPEKLVRFFDFLEEIHLNNLFDCLVSSSGQIKQLFDQLNDSSFLFAPRMFALAVLRDVPEEFYMESLVRNYQIITVITDEILKRAETTEIVQGKVARLWRIFDETVLREENETYLQVSEHLEPIKLIQTSSQDLRIEDLNMERHGNPFIKTALLFEAQLTGRIQLFTDLLNNLTPEEKKETFLNFSSMASLTNDNVTRTIFDIYRNLPADILDAVNGSDVFFDFLIKTAKVQDVHYENNQRILITFKTKAEYVNLGVPEEIVYYRTLSAERIIEFIDKLKFESEESLIKFLNLIPQSPDPSSDPILIASETICQIALSPQIQNIVKSLKLKFRLTYLDAELFKVPFTNNLNEIITIDPYDLLNLSPLLKDECMWNQFEKCIDKPFVDFVFDHIERRCYLNNDKFYFALRNAFDHWINKFGKGRIHEISNENMKERIIKDFQGNSE